VSHRHTVGDEGAEVAEGRRDIRMEAGEYPERNILCPDKGSAHRPARPRGEARYTVMRWRLPTTIQGADERFP
jgi:hypothetical protein